MLDFIHRCCKLDAWTYDHLRKHGPSVDELLSAASLADITVHAEHCEVDNIFTECNNAAIRKWVFQKPQQKGVQLEEASVLWAIHCAKHDVTGIWADHTEDEYVKAAKLAKVYRYRGGGGTCRAFVSRFSRTMRLPNGRPDFNAIMEAYYKEKKKEVSVVLQECAATGARAKQVSAARAARLQQDNSTSNVGTLALPTSNFGTMKWTAIHGLTRKTDLDRISRYFGTLSSDHCASKTFSRVKEMQIVATEESSVDIARDSLQDEVKTLHRLWRELKAQAREEDEKEEKVLQLELRQSRRTIHGFELAALDWGGLRPVFGFWRSHASAHSP